MHNAPQTEEALKSDRRFKALWKDTNEDIMHYMLVSFSPLKSSSRKHVKKKDPVMFPENS